MLPKASLIKLPVACWRRCLSAEGGKNGVETGRRGTHNLWLLLHLFSISTLAQQVRRGYFEVCKEEQDCCAVWRGNVETWQRVPQAPIRSNPDRLIDQKKSSKEQGENHGEKGGK